MNLTKVTFTGIDGRTDVDRLVDIHRRYPYVEFGVLMSYDWPYNGNRFPNPVFLKCLDGKGIPLSLHLCGTLAVNVLKGDVSSAVSLCDGCYDLFSRMQLNVPANGMFQEIRSLMHTGNVREVIVQMRSAYLLEDFLKGFIPKGVSYLLDSSGGRGIDTPLDIVNYSDVHIGYAGGIGVENVEQKLRKLLEYDSDEKFWIDMETKVRNSDDWFDLDKVEKILEISDSLMKEYHKKFFQR